MCVKGCIWKATDCYQSTASGPSPSFTTLLEESGILWPAGTVLCTVSRGRWRDNQGRRGVSFHSFIGCSPAQPPRTASCALHTASFEAQHLAVYGLPGISGGDFPAGSAGSFPQVFPEHLLKSPRLHPLHQGLHPHPGDGHPSRSAPSMELCLDLGDLPFLYFELSLFLSSQSLVNPNPLLQSVTPYSKHSLFKLLCGSHLLSRP